MTARMLAMLFLPALSLPAAPVAADSARGGMLFETLSCVQCHSINGKGGTVGPDLGRRIDRDFTPASLAATMWNHAPAMWASIRARNLQSGDLSDQAAADLFAYFYSVRFFDKPGDAGRGKRLFAAKHCTECHSPADAQWQSIVQPMALVNAMWNHATTMRQQFAQKNLSWPDLSTQELTDMLVYLRSLPAARNAPARLEVASGANGQALFQSKGCAACHNGNNALASRLKGQTLTDIAVDMWNHEPKMPALPAPLSLDEMRDLVSYVWADQFFQNAGNAAAGGRVFTTKRCAVCHNDPSSGAPKLAGSGRSFAAATMVSALWHHGPQMLDQMKAKNIPWPRLDGPEMANLIAYLNGGK
jgi:mono/diheme cytochrome c family protein